MPLKYNERTGEFYEVTDSVNGKSNKIIFETIRNEKRRYVVLGVEFYMIKVVGGTFTMGATSEMEPVELDLPCHEVSLSDYWIGETQVTQQLWRAIMGTNPSSFVNEQFPVVGTSWNICQIFVSKLAQLTGANFRLPTEAEWEYAARGGRKTHGFRYSGSNNPEDVAWFSQEKHKLHPVKMKNPNELGIYDMSGNGDEWCSDWVGNYTNNYQRNPKGPLNGRYKIARGGDWASSAKYCQCSFRSLGSLPDGNYTYHGLRLAL